MSSKKALAIACVSLLPLLSCTTPSLTEQISTVSSEMFTTEDLEVGYDEEYCTRIVFETDGVVSESDDVLIEDNCVTIQQAGTYLLEGSAADETIKIDVSEDEDVHLILNGLSICNLSQPAIVVSQASCVYLTTGVNSTNMLSVVQESTENAVIYASSNLTCNGQGSLQLLHESGFGMISTQCLKITSGTYTIDAMKNAVYGEQSVGIASGTYCLRSGEESIGSLGEIYIAQEAAVELCA